ncbi:exonuclease domain-containing protein [endosymbiont GvMRE of Glomus versiforme]|uniref:exonuclease domain-containing protein n=1 Tax=endosymbiont GvMRE of Glomus versiforme TaxID=2039283 RepID=UPI000EC80C5B|nr:exonuclease domain-containing protein [endosymbiont GvMRE of Glomus versiforme]RHZ35291.1 DNA polymerase III PolC [endosymbiont GvMRE of Glomus versiforme]
MFSKFSKELEIENDKELREAWINCVVSYNCLEISISRLLSGEALSKLFYSIYNKLNYLFKCLDFQIKVKNIHEVVINERIIHEYFLFIFSTPFMWKNKEDIIFFFEQKKILENFALSKNIVYLHLPNHQVTSIWKSKLVILKNILNKLGLSDIRFALNKNKTKERRNKNNSKSLTVALINKKEEPSLIKLNLFQEWKERKLFELGVHTKFSTLDGISSPKDYIENAQQKNYAALAVTDHYNVQSFPEFSVYQNNDLKIIYGCELEMLEDDLPPYIFNHQGKKNDQLLTTKIPELTYCAFDLETTGFFSTYNEIIEIGYVVYHQGKIIREGEYLICPEKEIAPEILANWYTDIDPNELKKAPKIKEILPTLRQEWGDNCILVAHNARNFDYGFLNKVWKECFNEELPYPVVDTLPLSWILLPERKSYSLEKLSRIPGQGKVSQAHRALSDSKLLADLLEKLLKILTEKKISYWPETKELINNDYFPNRGRKVKVLVCSQVGLNNLYHLITLSHTKRLFKKPCVFRSDLTKYRQGLLVGAAGGREGEIFTLFSAFNSDEKRKKAMRFYDYIEINSPETFRYLWLSGKIGEMELKAMIVEIIRTAEGLNLPTIVSHNVHYCQSKEKKLKEIVVANEGINGSRHYLYYEATREGKEDRFADLPTQHLLNLEEMIANWLWLGNKKLVEKIIFQYPQQLINKIGKVNIQQPPLNYSTTESIKKEEINLISAYTQRTNEIFGQQWPPFVKERIEKEWQIIKGRYVFIYWLAYKVVQKTHQDGSLVGSRGSIGSSFIAYLCGITDLNPLPFYKFCSSCRYTELYETKDRVYSCYDYQEKENCPNCSSLLIMEGHNLPFETFFGWEGEKTPDIDLNFSGEYQKTAHNYVRQLLGEDSVYRIGTINTLSQQTAEMFWKQNVSLRKMLNSQEHIKSLIDSDLAIHQQQKRQHWENLLENKQEFKEEKWYKEWIDWEKIKNLEKKLSEIRKEKYQIEIELKKKEID